MNTSRRSPDIEAESIRVKADEIKKFGYFHARNTHGGSRLVAKGDVEITVTKQHPGDNDRVRRPEKGAVLIAPGEKTKIEIEARKTSKKKRTDISGKDRGSADGRVEIFGKLRRSRE